MASAAAAIQPGSVVEALEWALLTAGLLLNDQWLEVALRGHLLDQQPLSRAASAVWTRTEWPPCALHRLVLLLLPLVLLLPGPR